MCNSVSAPFGNSGYYRLFPLHRAECSQCGPWLCQMSSLPRVVVLDQDSFIFFWLTCVCFCPLCRRSFDCDCCCCCWAREAMSALSRRVCSLTRHQKAGFKHAGQGTADGRRNRDTHPLAHLAHTAQDPGPPPEALPRPQTSTSQARQSADRAMHHSEGLPRY